jgi:hypothetical protein
MKKSFATLDVPELEPWALDEVEAGDDDVVLGCEESAEVVTLGVLSCFDAISVPLFIV